MLAALRWTTGISWDTPLRDIGWAWLILAGVPAAPAAPGPHMVNPYPPPPAVPLLGLGCEATQTAYRYAGLFAGGASMHAVPVRYRCVLSGRHQAHAAMVDGRLRYF